MRALRTAQVARQSGVNVETLRFYEREGILPEPPRSAAGYREYPADTVSRIRFVKRAQELGFSLREIKELLSVRQVPRQATSRVRRLVEEKVAEIDHKIRDLQAMRQALSQLLGTCQKAGSSLSCPIIDSLSDCAACRGEGEETA